MAKKSPVTSTIIKVFIASPGDLAVERRAFKDKIDELNKGFGRGANVEFVPLGWEDALAATGRRPQDVINKDVDACDVFVLVMLRRWGQKAPDAIKRGFTSYTEEEFYRALKRFEKTKAPTIFCFFKHIDTGEMASPGTELKKVLRFRKKLERSRQVLWRGFKNEREFGTEIDKHLIAFAKGEIEPVAEAIPESLLPDSAVKEIKKLREQAKHAEIRAAKAEREAKGAVARAAAAEKLAEAQATTKALELAESAAKSALAGRIEDARQDFAKALDGTNNIRVLFLGYEFFYRIGEFDEAERLLRRWLSITGPQQQTIETAAAYGNLGNIEHRRGNFDLAEEYHKKCLLINTKLERHVLAAGAHCNLGLIEAARGNLQTAEEHYKKSLVIVEKLGPQAGRAAVYGNLGTIEWNRGNLDAAEVYARKSLADYKELGQQEGIADQYGNLGGIEKARGNLDEAEKYQRLSTEIDEKLGRQLEIASDYFNMGVIANARGDRTEALRLWTLSRDLFREIGAKAKERHVQLLLNNLAPRAS